MRIPRLPRRQILAVPYRESALEVIRRILSRAHRPALEIPRRRERRRDFVLDVLARMGDGPAFQRLVEAYITDAGTYPKQETPPVPVGQPVSWSSGPSLASAVVSLDPGRVRP